MRNIENDAGGGGGSKEWEVLNQNNIRMTKEFMKSPATQVAGSRSEFAWSKWWSSGRRHGERLVPLRTNATERLVPLRETAAIRGLTQQFEACAKNMHDSPKGNWICEDLGSYRCPLKMTVGGQ